MLGDVRWNELAYSREQMSRLLCAVAFVMGVARLVEGKVSPTGEMVTAILLFFPSTIPRLCNYKPFWFILLMFLFGKNVVGEVALTQLLLKGKTFYCPPELTCDINNNSTIIPTIARVVAIPPAFLALSCRVGFSMRMVVWGGVCMVIVSVLPVVLFASHLMGTNKQNPILFSVCMWTALPMILMAWLLHENEQHTRHVQHLLTTVEKSKQRELDNQLQAYTNQQRIVRYIFHEVRNPINNIMLASELLARKISNSADPLPTPPSKSSKSPRSPKPSNPKCILEDVQDLTGDICQSTHAAMRVLNDALNLQQLQSGAFEFVYKPFTVEKLILSTMRMVLPIMRSKSIKTTTSISQELQTITLGGDFHRLQQVMLNYLSNASKFTPHNGTVSVCATVEATNSCSPHTNGESTNHCTTTAAQRIPTGGTEFASQCTVWSKSHCEKNDTTETKSLRISVCNTGEGIHDSDKPKIFKPWVQIRAGKKQEGQGSGLGLALCKAFIEAGHDGRVWFSSEVGKTTTFYFEIPLLLHSSSKIGTPSPKQLRHNTSRSTLVGNNPTITRRKSNEDNAPIGAMEHTADVVAQHVSGTGTLSERQVSDAGGAVVAEQQGSDVSATLSEKQDSVVDVLVVEDSPVCRKLIGKVLTTLGLSFDQCVDGQEAVEKVERLGLDHFKSILMDKEMPRLDGFGATTRLRSIGYSRPIIACTGNAMDDQVEGFLQAGADQVLGKPVNIKAISSSLQHFGVLVDSNKTTAIE